MPLKFDRLQRPSHRCHRAQPLRTAPRRRSLPPRGSAAGIGVTLAIALAVGTPGCKPARYRASADKEVYGILQAKQQQTFGKTNGFTIDTPYSAREPNTVPPTEILQDRAQGSTLRPAVAEVLQLALKQSRDYQFRKEALYLSALTLTRERHEFRPNPFARGAAYLTRQADGERTARATTDLGFDQLLKNGASLGVTLANDFLRYYTGDGRRSASTLLSLNFIQPLLRGAGRSIAAENLTQAERNVIYELREFGRFENTFAVDIVSSYYRLLQQKDTVRNEYNNFRSLTLARERAEALARDRFSGLQVDQAKQDELSARNRYLVATRNYQALLDEFKIRLGLPLGTTVSLTDAALGELKDLGPVPVLVTEHDAYASAIQHRLDLRNHIDRFEDSQRKVKVAANRLKADLRFVADAAIASDPPDDYANFDFDHYRASAGIELDLPVDRLRERNEYRASLIAFERQIRALALALDDVRDNVREGLRNLQQIRQSYVIQTSAADVAQRRVEAATLSLQAGRAQIRDLLEAQNALVDAQNAVTRTLVDYHVARWRFLIDIGVLDTGADRFWLLQPEVGPAPEAAHPDRTTPPSDEVIPPDQLFEQ
jgi:outer membrane protein TolC